ALCRIPSTGLRVEGALGFRAPSTSTPCRQWARRTGQVWLTADGYSLRAFVFSQGRQPSASPVAGYCRIRVDVDSRWSAGCETGTGQEVVRSVDVASCGAPAVCSEGKTRKGKESDSSSSRPRESARSQRHQGEAWPRSTKTWEQRRQRATEATAVCTL